MKNHRESTSGVAKITETEIPDQDLENCRFVFVNNPQIHSRISRVESATISNARTNGILINV